MADPKSNDTAQRAGNSEPEAEMNPESKPLRLWPGVAIVTLQWILRFALPRISADYMVIGVLGGLIGGLAVALWWLLFSRAPWTERLGAIAVAVAAMFVTRRLADPSIVTGAQGMLFALLAVPVVCLAFVAWAAVSRRLSTGPRWAAMAASLLLAGGVWTLVKTGGFTASFNNDLRWRWSLTPEERLLAEAGGAAALPPAPAAPKAPEAAAQPAERADEPAKAAPLAKEPVPLPPEEPVTVDWPGFRGPHRDGAVSGVRISTDWTASPPAVMWRRAIGPGWSSFAVRGDFLYTQEQRGPEEIVGCYKVSTGEPVWAHRDQARFWESNGGPGPRGTPTLSNRRVYTFGATGLLNVLNARDGSVVWSRNAASDAEMKCPQWGFASSPLVVDNLVIVAVSGRLIAYDLATGTRRWSGPARGGSYSSPQLTTIDGVPQVLLLSATGATSVALADGKVLWEHAWPGYPIVQPTLMAEGDILMSVADKSGTRRLAVAHGPGGWTTEERWTSMGLKPYFNDFVIHDGYAYGFDGSILACIDLKDGKRKWKGGRYGNGQMLLLPDQNLLLVTSEEGDMALVGATPDQYKEFARRPAIEGKTWNHPVLAGDVLLMRNGEEMAAFRLTLARR